jgi:hypothetical protein
MKNKTCHPSNSGAQHQRHQRDEQSCRNGSSGAPAPASAPAASSVEALGARISVLKEEEVALRNASCEYNSPSTSLSEDDAAAADAADAAAGEVSGMQILRIPTKSENDQPGPTLNPASCASALALLGGDWIPAQPRAVLAEGTNDGKGNTHRRNSSLENEDWDDFDLPRQFFRAVG